MKIGFDGRYATGDLVGIGNYIKYLVQNVSVNQKCVIFYSEKPKYPIEGKNIDIVILKTQSDFVFEQILLPISLRKHKIDLFHQTGNIGIPVFTSVKSILTVHDLIPLEVKNYFSFSKFPLISKYLYIFKLYNSCLMAKKIVTDSEHTKQDLINMGVCTNKIKVIKLGCSIPKKVSFRFIKNDYILNNGGIDIRKNLDLLIRSFDIIHKKKPAYKLIITGENIEILQKLKKLVNKLHLKQSVIFVGYVNDLKMASLLKYAKCLCYPSLLEGFGFPILEAFSYGVPVVTSNTSSIPEIAKDASILINPNNINQIANAILTVLSDNKLAENLRVSGYQKIKEFSWKKTANEYFYLYNS